MYCPFFEGFKRFFDLQNTSMIQIIEIIMNYQNSKLLDQTNIPTVNTNYKDQQLPFFAMDIITFQRTCTPPSHLTIYIKSFLRLMAVVHTFVGYLLLSNDLLSAEVKQVVDYLRTDNHVYRAIQIFVFIFNFLLLGVVISNKTNQKNKLKISIKNYLVTNYFLLGAVNLFMTFFLAYINLYQNIFAMVLACFIAIIENVFFQNYCLKNQLNYLSSQSYSLLFKCGVALNLIANCVFVNLGAFEHFIYSAIIFGLLALFWFMKGGYHLHYHKATKKIKLFLCSVWASFSIQLFILSLNDSKRLNFVQWTVACCLITVYLMIYCQDKRFTLKQLFEKQNLKEYELSLMFMLQEGNETDIQNIIVGLLSYHETHLCMNPKCKVTQYYKKTDTKISSFIKDKHELFINYIKCIYETELCKNRSKQNLIDYCEFMITQFSNFSTHCFYLEELILKQSSLSVFQKIKINKLRLILQEQSLAFNKLLFGGRVEFLDILDSDNHFAFIMQKINDYCTEAASIWENALLKCINVSEWKEAIKKNFQLLPVIDQKWKFLSKYFYVQKQWKFIYLNYAYYLKNEQVKNRQLEAVETDSSKLIEFGSDNRLKIIKDTIFFDTNTAVIEAQFKNRRLMFKKINKNFQKMTHYTAEEVINAPLSIIQPYEIRGLGHDERVWNIFERGDTLKEQGYHILGTYFVTKQGDKVDAIVLFKLYINSSSQEGIFHFVALIATTPQINNKIVIERNSSMISEKLEPDIQVPQQVNIFIKEEHLQATKDSLQYIKIVRVTRIVIFFVFACIFLAFFLINGQMNKAQGQIIQQQYMIKAYRYPMAITINYIKQFLNITDQVQVNAQIRNFTLLLMQLANDPMMINMLADQKINPPTTYSPFVVNLANKGLSYDQIDIFYVVLACIMTLSSSKPVNMTGNEYVRLDSYLKQYNRMINGTKMQLHKQFLGLMDKSQNYQIWMLIAISCTFLITTIYLSYRVYFYYKKRSELLRVILQFDLTQTNSILQYWRKINAVFGLYESQNQCQIQLKKSKTKLTSFVDYSFGQDEVFSQKKQGTISLNQRPKTIIVSEKEASQFYKLVGVLLTILLIIFVINIGVPIFSLTQFSKIRNFQNAGFDIFRFVAFTSQLNYALTRSYYYNFYPNQASLIPQQFSQTLSALDIMSKYQYVEVANSKQVFFSNRKNYMFGNPCTFNPNVLIANNASMQNCLSLADGSIAAGLSAYLRNIKPTVFNFIMGNLKLTLAQVNSLTSSLGIVTYYFYDMMYAWLGELKQMIVSFSNSQLVLIIVSCFVSALLYLTALQFWFISKLKEDYDLMKNIYNNYVPEAILLKQKVIKQKFCQTGIIN